MFNLTYIIARYAAHVTRIACCIKIHGNIKLFDILARVIDEFCKGLSSELMI
jgi:hypothetical protein